jgi:hypothetical protein
MKGQEIAELRGLASRDFRLWDADLLVVVDPKSLQTYPKRAIESCVQRV